MGRVDYLNIAAELITGWTREEARGRPIAEVLNIVDSVTGQPDHQSRSNMSCKATGPGFDRRSRPCRPPWRALPDRRLGRTDPRLGRQLVGAVMVFRDISDTVALTSKMRHLAHHDFLTNLPNRVLLNDRITQAIALARRSDSLPGAAVPRSRQIQAHQRLPGACRRRPLAARRLGTPAPLRAHVRHGQPPRRRRVRDPAGNERRPEDAALAAEKILTALSMPFVIDGQELHTSTSIGISVFRSTAWMPPP
jgi:GGDEF domain-containing protein